MTTKKITLNELKNLVKQIVKEEFSNETSIFDFVDTWKKEGYAVALFDENGKLIDEYLDPSDYPDMFLSSSNDNAQITSGKYKGGTVRLGSSGGSWKDLDYTKK